MEINRYLEILSVFEKLKNNTRHSYTSSGRKESVAEHCYRLAVMAYLAKDEYPAVDISKVVFMALMHDIGEAFTGDIPSFEKTVEHEETEEKKVKAFLDAFPAPYRDELSGLFAEMKAQTSEEAKLYKALDKMEAVVQHNEADIATWLPLEYDLQLTYGKEETDFSPFTRQLRAECNRVTREKIKNETSDKKP